MHNYKALSAFLEDLRVNGFSIGLVEEQRIVEILARLENARAVPSSVERLATIIGPVLCCTAEQQNLFKGRVEAHFAASNSKGNESASPIAAKASPNSEPRFDPRRQFELWEVWRSLPSVLRRQIIRRAFVMLISVLLLFYVVPTLLVRLGSLEPPQSTPVPQPEPAPRPTPLPQSRNSGAILKAIERYQRLSFNAISRSLEGPRAAWGRLQGILGPFTFLSLSIPFVLAGAWIVAPGRRKASYLSHREVRARPKFTQLLVSSKNDDLFGDFASARRLQPLRRPRPVNSFEINVEASIPRMLENGGVFEPVFRQRLMMPEYLILIDRRGPADHIARCGQAFAQALRLANVYVDLYWFDRDPRRLFRSHNSPSLALEEVVARHGEHRLLLIASGEGLFDWISGAVESWALILRQFSRRVMLTPVAPELWGYREQAIFDALDIAVLPFSVSAVEEMVGTLAADEPPRPVRPTCTNLAGNDHKTRLADLLEERPIRWLIPSPPSESEQDELLAALRGALSRMEWEWILACSVYPQIVWKLTLVLGSQIRRWNLGAEPFVDQLISIGRLPWLRLGTAPMWLRERLTSLMDSEEYQRVNRILSELLMTTLRPQRSSTALTIGDDRNEPSAAGIRDDVLVDFLSRAPGERTSPRLPDEVATKMSLGRLDDGWMRTVFSRRQMSEIRSDVRLVEAALSEGSVASVEVVLPGPEVQLGPDYRAVARLRTRHGNIVPGEGFVLYLPAGSSVAHMANDWTVDLHIRNRKLAFRLGVLNFLLVLISLLVFYGDPDRGSANVAVHLLIAMSWIAVPFLALYGYLVFPISRVLKTFPTAKPSGSNPSHLSTQYELVL